MVMLLGDGDNGVCCMCLLSGHCCGGDCKYDLIGGDRDGAADTVFCGVCSAAFKVVVLSNVFTMRETRFLLLT